MSLAQGSWTRAHAHVRRLEASKATYLSSTLSRCSFIHKAARKRYVRTACYNDSEKTFPTAQPRAAATVMHMLAICTSLGQKYSADMIFYSGAYLFPTKRLPDRAAEIHWTGSKGRQRNIQTARLVGYHYSCNAKQIGLSCSALVQGTTWCLEQTFGQLILMER